MKIYILKRLALTALLCSGSQVAFAQGTDSPSNTASGLAGCGCCSTFLAIPIIIFVLNIALLVWVARDAKARGMDSSILWMILVLFTSFIGLIIYLFSRPQGNLIQCSNCNNQKLQAAVRCPHCGFGG